MATFERSMRVGAYMDKWVAPEDIHEFYRLMVEWDGCRNVCLAFYDMSVLHMKNAEAEERRGK